ncbi:hypothetical protein [Coleofasciculus sp. FACHB-SPT9]|uniref:hypothetical protein n=1 Tax=Cyanophyceae TaxID=3028117 RepID=UPI0016877E6A|nr:hypothetical protein [Coleofasciculus sp. FACHB-SPT9]MBD1889330.1 hypothetical protein [Coleofasciculus sp. FACHB-SPT9]
MFNPSNHQPHHEADFLSDESQVKESKAIKSYRVFGNISEFGLYFSGGLTLALLCRLIPGMLITYALLLACSTGYLVLTAKGNPQVNAIIGLAITTSLIGSFWDLIISLILVVNPLCWIGMILAGFAVGLSIFIRRSGQ